MIRVINFKLINSENLKAEFKIELFGVVSISHVRLYNINGNYAISFPFWRNSQDQKRRYYISILDRDVFKLLTHKLAAFYESQYQGPGSNEPLECPQVSEEGDSDTPHTLRELNLRINGKDKANLSGDFEES